MKKNDLIQGSKADHNKAKKERKQMDHYTCILCHRTADDVGKYKITAHHLVKKELGGRPSTDNMITLCRDCHDKVHAQGSELIRETN